MDGAVSCLLYDMRPLTYKGRREREREIVCIILMSITKVLFLPLLVFSAAGVE